MSSRATRIAAMSLLATALALGAVLRFYRLGTADLSADEAAAWAAASAPGLREVVSREAMLDPGKLAIFDLALHGWIALFGDGVGAMRAMSAVLGTLAIALMFVAARALLSVLVRPAGIQQADLRAAVAALLLAVNLTFVTQARTLRMYPLVLAFELSQVVCLVQALRSGGIVSLIGVAIFGALAAGTNFTAGLLIAAEILWLAYAWIAGQVGFSDEGIGRLQLLRVTIALFAGIAALAPFAPGSGGTAIGALHAGALNWAKMRGVWWPFGMLQGASGKAPFLVLAPMALYGAWRMSRDGAAGALGFLLWWLAGPLVFLMVISYVISPLEETRYAISSLAAFLIFAAAGLAVVGDSRLRAALIALAVVLSLDHVRRDFIKPQFVEWREATELALRIAGPGTIAVSPAYAVNAVRYYLPTALRSSATPASGHCEGAERVLVLSGRGVADPIEIARLEDCYPTIAGHLRLVEVRTR
jgi:mannosyltransferase